jgi:hypothetical protein
MAAAILFGIVAYLIIEAAARVLYPHKHEEDDE